MGYRLSLLSVCVVLMCGVWSVSATKVEVKGRGLYVNDKIFTVQAVGYAPTPIGVDPTVTDPYGDYFTTKFSAIWQRDVPILAALGANTIKLWGWNNAANHTDFLDAAFKAGLYVIPTFFMSRDLYPSLYDGNVKAKIQSDFGTFLANIKGHQAVLFYNIGSDLNADWNYASQQDALTAVLDLLATQAKQAERPASSALNDGQGLAFIKTYDSTSKIDLWSLNLYRGCDFGSLFKDFVTASTKPLFISEFGIDAVNDAEGAVDELTQAQCYSQLWGEIEANSSVSIGGAVTEYSDEFWKSKLAQTDARHPQCPSYDPTVHTFCGYPNAGFPDKYANEAWFGIVDASFKPRLAYSQLQELWTVEK